MPANPPVIPIAVGVLQRADGAVLIAQRPSGKIAAGWWEFPGGKIEADETTYQALVRELEEELGVTVTQAQPLIQITQHYTERSVRLDAWRVTAWTGTPQGVEGQALDWVLPAHLGANPPFWQPHDGDLARSLSSYEASVHRSGHSQKFLPTNRAIGCAAWLPDTYLITGAFNDVADCLNRLQAALQRGVRLVRLRAWHLNDADYEALARDCVALTRAAGALLILDRDMVMALRVGADGVHGLEQVPRRPPSPQGGREHPFLHFASCHNVAELQAAEAAGCDAVVLGPVLQTHSHPDAVPMGWDAFGGLAQRSNIPVYGLGGLTPEHLTPAKQHGAQGIAAISSLW